MDAEEARRTWGLQKSYELRAGGWSPISIEHSGISKDRLDNSRRPIVGFRQENGE